MAAEADFVLKRNDWGEIEPLRARLKKLAVDPESGEVEKDEAGNPVYVPLDLTNAEAVRLILCGRGLAPEDKDLTIITGPLTFADRKGGIVEYDFLPAEGEDPADAAVDGDYDGEFKATWKEAKGKTGIPTIGFLTIRVELDLE